MRATASRTAEGSVVHIDDDAVLATIDAKGHLTALRLLGEDVPAGGANCTSSCPRLKKGCVLLTRRWVVERSFGCLARFWGVSHDFWSACLLWSAALDFPVFVTLMLPKAAYLDPEVFRWEMENVFGGWVCVGRSSEVPERRSMKAFAGPDGGILVTRGRTGRLYAFENACRHRGHELLPCGGSAQAPAIVCPYHAWSYDGEGVGRCPAGGTGLGAEEQARVVAALGEY